MKSDAERIAELEHCVEELSEALQSDTRRRSELEAKVEQKDKLLDFYARDEGIFSSRANNTLAFVTLIGLVPKCLIGWMHMPRCHRLSSISAIEKRIESFETHAASMLENSVEMTRQTRETAFAFVQSYRGSIELEVEKLEGLRDEIEEKNIAMSERIDDFEAETLIRLGLQAEPALLSISTVSSEFGLRSEWNDDNGPGCSAKVNFRISNETNTTARLFISIFSTELPFAAGSLDSQSGEWDDSSFYSISESSTWQIVPGNYTAPWAGAFGISSEYASDAYEAYLAGRRVGGEFTLFYSTGRDTSAAVSETLRLPISDELGDCLRRIAEVQTNE